MAVIIPYGLIKPLDPKSDIGICVQCLDKRARWAVFLTEDEQLWCSWCFLTGTAWARNSKQQLDDLIVRVEQDMGVSLRDQDGILIQDESDRILMAIVTLSAYVHGKRIREGNRS